MTALPDWAADALTEQRDLTADPDAVDRWADLPPGADRRAWREDRLTQLAGMLHRLGLGVTVL